MACRWSFRGLTLSTAAYVGTGADCQAADARTRYSLHPSASYFAPKKAWVPVRA